MTARGAVRLVDLPQDSETVIAIRPRSLNRLEEAIFATLVNSLIHFYIHDLLSQHSPVCSMGSQLCFEPLRPRSIRTNNSIYVGLATYRIEAPNLADEHRRTHL